MDPGPSNTKRKRDESEEDDEYPAHDGFMDDDSEPHRFGASVLPVANLPHSFDRVPQDGLEYLFTVRREERRLPLVTRVHNPYPVKDTTWFKGDSHEKVSENSTFVLPSEEWRVCFEERFRHFRANIQQPTIHVTIPVPSDSGTPKVPEMRERDRWWAFFRGDVNWEDVPSSQYHGKKFGTNVKRRHETMEYEDELPKQGEKMRGWVVYEEKLSWDQADEDGITEISYAKQDEQPSEVEQTPHKCKDETFATEAALPTPRGSHSPPTVVKSGSTTHGREPTPTLLSSLDQRTTFHLLKYFTQWIQGHFDRSVLPAPPPPPGSQTYSHEKQYNLTPTHARWMFALLSRLDGQLTSNEISVLRKLAREVLRVIKDERMASKDRMSSSMGETACWMIVAAVSSAWGQKDLWMDAKEALC